MKNKKEILYGVCDQKKGNVPYVIVPTRISDDCSIQEYLVEHERIEKELGMKMVHSFTKAQLETYLSQIKVLEAQ